MPSVFPFRAVQYTAMTAGKPGAPADVSALVAPPYDVLDAEGKANLLRKNENNIVAVDLPHIPAKELGPPAAYEAAATTFRNWLTSGVMAQRSKPAMFVYRQTFTTIGGAKVQRTGMACTIEALPFGPRPGGGILPHEETFSGPKEDRMALMKATKAQLSPIFGLHQDEQGKATALLQSIAASRGADATAVTDDGTLHEVWTVEDEATIGAYAAALAGEDIFIADGHHRYNTALNYLRGLEEAGTVPADHPARRVMIVLVGMSDPGLVIWPTHRILGGMAGWSWDAFAKAAAGKLEITSVDGDLTQLEAELAGARATGKPNVMGLYDFAGKKCYTARPTTADPLADRFPEKPQAWRQLDVALTQYLIVEGICQPALNNGESVKWAFPHTIAEVEEIGAGKEKGSGGGKAFTPQLGVILAPTPLEAVRAVSRAGELMPQKSTFFFPKLATGLFVNSVE